VEHFPAAKIPPSGLEKDKAGHIFQKCKHVVQNVRRPSGQKIGTDWQIINAGCLELSGTQWASRPEFCPTMSHVAEPEVVLPGVASRDAVHAEIDLIKIVKVRP
jgi:hypothetical protein